MSKRVVLKMKDTNTMNQLQMVLNEDEAKHLKNYLDSIKCKWSDRKVLITLTGPIQYISPSSISIDALKEKIVNTLYNYNLNV